MKKLVLRLDLEDGKAKQKAMRTVSTLQGIDSIAVDLKEKKMTLIGTVDPVHVVSKLRKYWQADIIIVGPAKEPEKKEEPKPAPAPAVAAAALVAEEGKKEEGKVEEGGGKKEEKKEEAGGGGGDGGGKKEEGGEGGGGDGKKEEGEAPPKKKKAPQMMPQQPIPEHLMEMMRARQYNPYMGMGNYPPYMAMANPYMNHQPQMHPQMYHHQPTYYVQSVEENPNGCTIF